MIIDGHAHAARDFAKITTVISLLNQNGVDKVILCPSPKNRTDISDPPKIFMGKKERGVKKLFSGNKFVTLFYRLMAKRGDPNRFVADLQQQAPERIIQFFWVDFKSNSLMSDLNRSINEYDYRGLKIHQAWTPFDFNSSIFSEVVEFAQRNCLPIFIHPRSVKELNKLKVIAQKNQSVNFIISHLMGLDVFKDYNADNIYHDISPHDLLTNNIYDAIASFGADKIIFGSDMPFGDLGKNINKVKNLNINQVETDLILGGNIKRLLSR